MDTPEAVADCVLNPIHSRILDVDDDDDVAAMLIQWLDGIGPEFGPRVGVVIPDAGLRYKVARILKEYRSATIYITLDGRFVAQQAPARILKLVELVRSPSKLAGHVPLLVVVSPTAVYIPVEKIHFVHVEWFKLPSPGANKAANMIQRKAPRPAHLKYEMLKLQLDEPLANIWRSMPPQCAELPPTSETPEAAGVAHDLAAQETEILRKLGSFIPEFTRQTELRAHVDKEVAKWKAILKQQGL
ncbi:hypothetical protein Pelo_17348 [Pelomyxa schiedti]|nr:hypothetical protein Pelo_17348 [Pelomyxa schiedti]